MSTQFSEHLSRVARRVAAVVATLSVTCIIATAADEAESGPSRRARDGGAVIERRADTFVSADTRDQLPPLPAGVEELKFKDFFTMPVGPRGLELTTRLREADGRRVRILGYMVRQSRPSPGVLLLAPYPAVTRENEDGLCEDLPPQVVHVHVAEYADLAVPFTPGLLLLTGIAEVGPQDEPDGRRSIVRLQLDPRESPAANVAAAATDATTAATP